MSHPVVPPFQISGPDNNLYPGTVCLPQVPLPPNLTFKVGDNITIQVIETAQHGAALYNVSPFTLTQMVLDYRDRAFSSTLCKDIG